MFGNEITYCADKFQFNKILHSVNITAIFNLFKKLQITAAVKFSKVNLLYLSFNNQIR